MNIQGLQKMTLLDYPGKIACTIFTGGCNLRCPFCHNASLVINNNKNICIPESEIFEFLATRKGILDGVCITGGEPLLQPDINEFIKKIKEIGFLIKLDTNGCFPDKLKELVSEDLIDYVAMDIKNSPESYPKTVGIDGFDTSSVKQSVKFLKSGIIPYEFRTTVIKELHTAEDFKSIAKWLQGTDTYFLQAFVDSGDLITNGLHACTQEEMFQYVNILKAQIKNVNTRGI